VKLLQLCTRQPDLEVVTRQLKLHAILVNEGFYSLQGNVRVADRKFHQVAQATSDNVLDGLGRRDNRQIISVCYRTFPKIQIITQRQ
jgi:hypothetical protein